MDAGIVPQTRSHIGQASLEERLEQGECLVLEPTPVPLPSPEERYFLAEQHVRRAKEIIYDPRLGRMTGAELVSYGQQDRLQHILERSCRDAAAWLEANLPRYAAVAVPIRTCLHPEEEATRRLRTTARNDLLHIDALHHTCGSRILRLFVNINPTEPRVWATSSTLDKVLPHHGPKSGLIASVSRYSPMRLGQEMLRLFRNQRNDITPHDEFMLAFSRYLKHSEEFQDKAPRQIWRFAPGASWLAFTDGLVHADLRGRGLIDHVFLIPTSLWTCPAKAPANLLANFSQASRAA